ncbi:MAG: biotin--[Firmicutes bacterium]|nr:biotin--[acetyl-CoA-carboxylase] ligase [Bacillota bacterium]
MKKEYIEAYLQAHTSKLQIQVEQEVTSTNLILKQQGQDGAPEGTVLIACRQTAGKGRMGRSFYSPEETGIYMSILLRPTIKAQNSLLITTAAAVAVAEAIEKVTGVKTGIKWVNDIYCRGRKVVGILTEGSLKAGTDQLSYAVLGIGINLWEPTGGFPEEIVKIAGSVLTESFQPDTIEKEKLRCRLAAEVLNQFMKIYPQLTEKKFMDAYRKRSLLIGRKVQLMQADHAADLELPPVRVVDVGDDAQLIVELSDGSLKEISSGEVSVKMQ